MLNPQTAMRPRSWNLPNQITLSRLVLALLLFVVLHLQWYQISAVVFLLAALTDWVDGYLARKTGQITQLGRIMDPFADKIVVCGTFIFLAAVPRSQIQPWMAVLVVGREMLVTVLRSFLEQYGQDFSAKMSGKLKMGFQCAAAVGSLILSSYITEGGKVIPIWLPPVVAICVWLAVLLTVYSGIVYLHAAVRLVRQSLP